MNAEIVRRLPLFRGLSEDDLQDLINLTTWGAYPAGRTVVDPARDELNTYIVYSGVVRVFGRDEITGHEMTAFLLNTGDILDMVALPLKLRNIAYAEALGGTVVLLRFVGKDLRTFIKQHEVTIEPVLNQARQRIFDAVVIGMMCGLSSSTMHVAHWGVRLAELDPEGRVSLTQEEWARLCGLSRSQFQRCLRLLERRGLMVHEPHHRSVRVIDLEKLARFDDAAC